VAIGVNNGYASIYASGRLQYRLGRYVPIYGEYVYYNYRFDQQVGLASSFPLVMNRHGLRVGLTYSVPLIGRRVG
jgi:hypothetical protein